MASFLGDLDPEDEWEPHAPTPLAMRPAVDVTPAVVAEKAQERTWASRNQGRLTLAATAFGVIALLASATGRTATASTAGVANTGYDPAAKAVMSAWANGRDVPYAPVGCAKPVTPFPNPEWVGLVASLPGANGYTNEVHRFVSSNGDQSELTLRVKKGFAASSVTVAVCPTPVVKQWVAEPTGAEDFPYPLFTKTSTLSEPAAASVKSWAEAFWKDGRGSLNLLRLTGDVRPNVAYDGMGRKENITIEVGSTVTSSKDPKLAVAVVNFNVTGGGKATYWVLVGDQLSPTPTVTAWATVGTLLNAFDQGRLSTATDPTTVAASSTSTSAPATTVVAPAVSVTVATTVPTPATTTATTAAAPVVTEPSTTTTAKIAVP
jgi:hypothetical protein